MRGGSFSRWLGIDMGVIGVLVWLSWIPIVPFWAILVMILNILVIYGLAVYGGEDYERV